MVARRLSARSLAACAVALLGCSGGDEGFGGGAPSGPGSDVDAGADESWPPVDAGPREPRIVDMIPLADPCEGASCGIGQRCEPTDAGVLCIDNTCEALACGADESCEADPGGGFYCADAACESDVDCAPESFCDQGVCRADVCQPGGRVCDENSVLECSANGSEDEARFACTGSAYFAATCVDVAAGVASCSCEDDWDCPAYTRCEAGLCQGTGVEPSCSLPAIPFAQTPPAVELHWGGDARDDDDAHDGTAEQKPAPWAAYSHVVDTPMVANLDDDNGDGLIDELDFPEIVFVAHQGNNPWSNGVLRAIHGGGPNKGADYFARCGDALWTRASQSEDSCEGSDPDADAGAPVAIGDIDGDGVPEIVYTTEGNRFRILDNTGAERYRLAEDYALDGEGDSPSIANLDFAGNAEIVLGHHVYVIGDDGAGGLTVTHLLTGDEAMGSNQVATMACVADILPDVPGQEIVAGATLYRMPDALPTCDTPPCAGSLEVVWNAPDVPDNSGASISGEGFCAVADIWGADPAAAPGPDNPPDGKPEVILIDNGDLTVLDAETGRVIHDRGLGGGVRGGAPNVDDFDGDGFMEVASALQNFYVVIDLQSSTGDAGSCPDWPDVIARVDELGGAHNPNPARSPGGACTSDADCDPAAVCSPTLGQCVCLHNGWRRDSDDDSSRATSSSVFDFNGDGATEVLYNDECEFRVYDGRTGEVLFAELSRSRTGIENPVVADVDNDGNAEVVTGMNTAQGDRCDDDPGGVPLGPNGVRVWGDPTDTWVSARRIWNQQSYHVTNVTEGGAIPAHPPESWASFGGRVYNTYRSQPRSFGVAPDLLVGEVGVSSPGAQCGSLSDEIDIAFELQNAGDLRVGPGVIVRFTGSWGDDSAALLDAAGDPLEVAIQNSLEPGASVILSVRYHRDNNGRDALPDAVRVVVDPAGSAQPEGAERECIEDNNSATASVVAGDARPDLSIALGTASSACPGAAIETVVRNEGSAPASSILVRYYAGDPSQGGSVLYEETIAGPLAPGEEAAFTASIPEIPGNRSITVYAVVDPEHVVAECDEADNKDQADATVHCRLGPD